MSTDPTEQPPPKAVAVVSEDAEQWPEVAVWSRLDALAGLVLQTGAAVLVAAMAFGLQAHNFDRVVLFTAAAFAFSSVLVSCVALEREPPGADPDRSPVLRTWWWLARVVFRRSSPGSVARLERKRRFARTSLGLLLVAVEGGALLIFVNHL